MAAMDGRFSVAIDDIKKVAVPVLRHRVSTNFSGASGRQDERGRDSKLLATISEPDVGKYERHNLKQERRPICGRARAYEQPPTSCL